MQLTRTNLTLLILLSGLKLLFAQNAYTDQFSTNLNNWDDKHGSYWSVSGNELFGSYGITCGSATCSQSALILDNQYQISDNWRASIDFIRVVDQTANTLYYAIADFSLWQNSSNHVSVYLGNAGWNNWGGNVQDSIRMRYSKWNGSLWAANSSKIIIINDKFSWDPNQWHTGSIEKVGVKYNLYFDGNLVGFFFECGFTGAVQVGLHTYGTRRYDNFKLDSITPDYSLNYLKDTEVCSGDSIEVSLDFDCVDSVRWSDGILAKTRWIYDAGVYSALVYAGGYTYYDTIQISDPCARETSCCIFDKENIVVTQQWIDSLPHTFVKTVPNYTTINNRLYFMGMHHKIGTNQWSDDSIRVYNLFTKSWEYNSCILPYKYHDYASCSNVGLNFALSPAYDNSNFTSSGNRKKIIDVDFNNCTSAETATVGSHTAIWNMTNVRVGNQVYFYGGHTGSDQNVMYAYDFNSQNLTMKGTTSFYKSRSRMIYIEGKIYIIGREYISGFTGNSNKIEVYNVNTNSTSVLSANLPTSFFPYDNILLWHVPHQNRIYMLNQGTDNELYYLDYDKDEIKSTGYVVEGTFTFASIIDAKDSCSIYALRKNSITNRYTDIVKLTITSDVNLSSDTLLCEGETLNLGIFNACYDSLLWNTGATTDSIVVTKPGKYTVKAFGLDTSYSASVNVAYLNSKIIPSSLSVCYGDTVSLGYGSLDSSIGSDICDTLNFSADIKNGLAFYAPFCSSIIDQSSSGYTVVQSNTTFVENRQGVPSSALQFDGSSSSFRVNAPNLFANEFTYSGWYKWEAPSNGLAWQAVFTKNNYCDNIGVLYNSGTNFIRIYKNNNCLGVKDYAVNLDDCGWHHFAFSFDGDSLTTYLDNKKVGAIYFQGGTEKDTLHIGEQGDNHVYNWSGQIDDVMVYKRALSKDEVRKVYDLIPNGYSSQIGCSLDHIWSTLDSNAFISRTLDSTTKFILKTETSNKQCIDSVVIEVKSPDASIAPAGPFCLDAGVQIIKPTTSGGLFTPSQFIDSAGNFDPNKAGVGSHFIYYTIAGNSSCTITDSAMIQIDSLPNAKILFSDSVCQNTSPITLETESEIGLFQETSYIDSLGNFSPALASLGINQVYYEVTDGNGCYSIDSSEVWVDSVPDASIIDPGPFCMNDQSTVIQTITEGGVFEETSYIDSIGNFTPNQASLGNNKIYYSLSLNGCSSIDSAEGIVNTIPDASILPINPLCNNDQPITILPAVTMNGYFHGSSGLDSSGILAPAVLTAGNHNVFYSVTDSNFCSNTDSLIIVIDSVPNSEIIDAGPYCRNGASQQIETINSIGKFIETNYIDSNGIFNPIQTADKFNLVVYEVQDGNGCISIDSSYIKVDTVPNASIVQTAPFCLNAESEQIIPINVGGSFIGSSYIDTTGVFTPNLASIGLNQIKYTITDENGCINIDSALIIVYGIPNASIQLSGPFCINGDAVLIEPEVVGGTFMNFQYIDSFGFFKPINAQIGQNRIFYSIVDSNQCFNRDSIEIMVVEKPDASIIDPGTFCANENYQVIEGTNGGGAFVIQNYIDSKGVFNPAKAQIGLNKVKYSLTDDVSCTAIDSILVQVDSVPNASIQSAGPFCKNSTEVLIQPNNSGGQFIKSSFLDSVGNLNPAEAALGENEIFYSITDGNMCYNKDSILIQVDSVPNASILPAGPYCQNEAMQIISSQNSIGQFVTSAYIGGSGEFLPDLASIGFNPIYYSVVDGNGCFNIDSAKIEVYEVSEVSLNNPGPICANGANFKMTPNPLGGFFDVTSYIDVSGEFLPYLAKIGNNDVVYTYTNAFGCTSLDSIEIFINPVPTNKLYFDPSTGCSPLKFNAWTETQNNVQWYLNNNSVSSNYGFIDTLVEGNHKIELIIENDFQCKLKIDSNIVVSPRPNALFSINPEDVYMDNPVANFIDESSNDVIYWEWKFEPGQFSYLQNPTHYFQNGGSHNIILIVENEAGCADTVTNELRLISSFEPNAFSPNGDGINDYFRIKQIGYSKVSIQIYSRWGEKIFESDHFDSWDGTYQGRPVQDGCYPYILVLEDSKGRTTNSHGLIHLIR